jgi:hypothetical protein
MTPLARYITIGALAGLVAATMGLGIWQARRATRAWRQAEADIMARAQRAASAWRRDDQPAPHLTSLGEHAADAIAVTAPCALCDLGLGRCVCTVRCIADACTGRLTLTTWTEHDFTFAARHGFSLPERSEL